MSESRYAVLIACSEYPNEPKLLDLACPTNDVDGLNEILSAPKFGDFTEVRVLKNQPHYEVLRTINMVLKKAAKDDFVLIYYSGHGKLDQAGRLYLAAPSTEVSLLEATSIPVQSIRSYLDVSRTVKSALILDCCYSGAVEKAFLRGDVDEQLNIMSSGRGTFIMTSATGVQTAREKESDGLGVFTKHLIAGIRSGEADKDGDGLVTMNEMYNYVHDRVLNESHQEPMRWGLNVRGELILAKSGKSSREDRKRQIRAVLLDLAGRNVLPDEILTAALHIIGLRRSELNAELAEFDALLDALTAEHVNPGNFIGGWNALQLKHARGHPREHTGIESRADPTGAGPVAESIRPTDDDDKGNTPDSARPRPAESTPPQRQKDLPTDEAGRSWPVLAASSLLQLFFVYCLPAIGLLVFTAESVVRYNYKYSYQMLHEEALIAGLIVFTVVLFSMAWILKRLRDARRGGTKGRWLLRYLFPSGYRAQGALRLAWVGLIGYVAIAVIGFFAIAGPAL